MTTHTPGPWDIRNADAITPDYLAITSNGVTLALVPLEGIFNEKANARLIAAAPELLAHIKKITDKYPAYIPTDEWYEKSKKLIARAEDKKHGN